MVVHPSGRVADSGRAVGSDEGLSNRIRTDSLKLCLGTSNCSSMSYWIPSNGFSASRSQPPSATRQRAITSRGVAGGAGGGDPVDVPLTASWFQRDRVVREGMVRSLRGGGGPLSGGLPGGQRLSWRRRGGFGFLVTGSRSFFRLCQRATLPTGFYRSSFRRAATYSGGWGDGTSRPSGRGERPTPVRGTLGLDRRGPRRREAG